MATITPSCHETAKQENFGFKIYQGNTLVKEFKFNADGSFGIPLAVGTYMVYGDNEGGPGTATTPDMWAPILPKQIIISANTTTTLNLSTSYFCNAQ
jgi:hypothetical protein